MNQRRHLLQAGAIWVVLTVIAYLWALGTELQPFAAAEEAEVIDGAFNFLLLLSIPVFTFVLTVLLYTFVVFRTSDDAEEAESAPQGKGFVWIWAIISTALAVTVIIHPGLTGIAELKADEPADVTIEVTASQWRWDLNYVDEGIELIDATELVVPVDSRIRFVITSTDVIHSFWIPAFRMKADAVPGVISEFSVTPDVTGTLSMSGTGTDTEGLLESDQLRVQCAELCGTGHSRMSMAVSVVEEADFEAWLAGQTQEEG